MSYGKPWTYDQTELSVQRTSDPSLPFLWASPRAQIQLWEKKGNQETFHFPCSYKSRTYLWVIFSCAYQRKWKQQTEKAGTRISLFSCIIMTVKCLQVFFVWHLKSGVSESSEEAHKSLTRLQVLTFLWRTDIFYRIITHHDWSSVDKLKTQPLLSPGSDSLLK